MPFLDAQDAYFSFRPPNKNLLHKRSHPLIQPLCLLRQASFLQKQLCLFCGSPVCSSDMCQPFVKVCQRTGCSPAPSLCLCVYFLPDAGSGALTRQPWKWKCKRLVIYHPSPAVLRLEVSPPITGQDHRKLPSVGSMVTGFALKLMCYLEQMKYDTWRQRGGEGARRCGDGNGEMVGETWRRVRPGRQRAGPQRNQRGRAKLHGCERDGWKERRQGLRTCSV